MTRRGVLIFTLIITLSASIFYFMQNNRTNAINALFIGIYLSLTLYLILRILFYFRYKATLNELFFVMFTNLMATAVILAGPFSPLAGSHIFELTITGDASNPGSYFLTLVSLLALPYFVVSMILQIRSFTKYEFYRISPTSEKGPKAEWIAILVYFIFGVVFVLVGNISSDLLSVGFGFYYLLSGIGFLIAK